MQLKDFMYYPNLGCRLAMIRCYEWRGSKLPAVEQTLIQQLWFLLGAINLFYQNLGLVIDLSLSETQKELSAFIAQISETCSVMGLTLVGASNMWMLLYYRREIEAVLGELQELYPPRRQRIYRIKHYYEQSTRLMKHSTTFFLFAYAYYNSLPIVELCYELLAASQQVKYKAQSDTWYPWHLFLAERSALSFAASYLCQAISSLSGVAVIMSGQYLMCFFTTQMRMHFDALANGLSTLDARHSEANEQLKEMIVYHCRLLHIEQQINRIFNFMFLSNFSTSTIAICLMAFAMVMINLAAAFKYSVGLMSFLVFCVFICYNGTQFTLASDKLLPAAFYNNWYDGDRNYRRMLLFFIMRSCESRVLRTYKFTPVSMATYMAMLKFSYQLFTFFRAMIK
ncbi:putative odorant receptor 69a [Drosophila albomicans]|uniref:Odorant receptor n=1 Tax=Drosophila albomicans TaxID=7291 RepID=A0A6P8WYS0_DROAB|nr:putative odorant receptor 69a [Drosophila albomicans]